MKTFPRAPQTTVVQLQVNKRQRGDQDWPPALQNSNPRPAADSFQQMYRLIFIPHSFCYPSFTITYLELYNDNCELESRLNSSSSMQETDNLLADCYMMQHRIHGSSSSVLFFDKVFQLQTNIDWKFIRTFISHIQDAVYISRSIDKCIYNPASSIPTEGEIENAIRLADKAHRTLIIRYHRNDFRLIYFNKIIPNLVRVLEDDSSGDSDFPFSDHPDCPSPLEFTLKISPPRLSLDYVSSLHPTSSSPHVSVPIKALSSTRFNAMRCSPVSQSVSEPSLALFCTSVFSPAATSHYVSASFLTLSSSLSNSPSQVLFAPQPTFLERTLEKGVRPAIVCEGASYLAIRHIPDSALSPHVSAPILLFRAVVPLSSTAPFHASAFSSTTLSPHSAPTLFNSPSPFVFAPNPTSTLSLTALSPRGSAPTLSQILVKFESTTTAMTVDRSFTVQAVKENICCLAKLDPNSFFLLFLYKRLAENYTLCDYNIKQDDLLHLAPRMFGGMQNPSPSQDLKGSTRPPCAASEAPLNVGVPFQNLDWAEIGLRYIPSLPIANPQIDSGNPPIRHGTDFQAIIAVDGSYQSSKTASTFQQGGCAFICHLLETKETWIAARHLPKSTANNSAPVSEAEGSLLALDFLLLKNVTRALIIHDNFDMHSFMSNKSTSAKKCSRYARLKDNIVDRLGKIDAMHCCHVRSHQGVNGLAENEAADQLASLWMTFPQLRDLNPTLLRPNISIKKAIVDSLIQSYGPSFGCFTETNFPVEQLPTLPSSYQCDFCGCPSHGDRSCFMHKHRPSMSSYTREKPIKRAAFCESFLQPSTINWDEAPAVMSDHNYVQFLGTMFSLTNRSETILEAYHGLLSLKDNYYYNPIRHKLEKKKPDSKLDCDGPNLDSDPQLHAFEDEARKLHTFAKIADERKWGRAMNFVHKAERISVLDPRLESQWDAIHPKAPLPEDHLSLEYNPSTFEEFEIDRYMVSKKIDSWDVTKAAGLNGFPPAFLIHFNNLTAKLETPDAPNPYFTSLVLFIQRLASGKIEELRNVAINYKGSFLNKVPSHIGFKVRNLGIADVFHRLACYTVFSKSIRPAIDSGLLTDFDLGSGKLGGVEKFVKIAQALANHDEVVALSSDIEKAYNNILRTDTWKAIQEINFPPLTQWFIYAYGNSPVVNYIIDSKKPASGANLVRAVLDIGIPQGDNLSGFLFSITLRYILKQYFKKLLDKNVKSAFATVLDDTIAAFNKRLCQEANINIGVLIEDFIKVLAHHNLKINVDKSVVYTKSVDLNLVQQVRRIKGLKLSSDGFDVCKIPIGNASHIQSFIDNTYLPRITAAYDSMLHIWEALYYLKNHERFNTFYIFLRLCFASKFVYWVRNLLPTNAHPVARTIDGMIDSLASKLYPQLPSNITWRQPHFVDMMRISKLIEALPLAHNGAGIARLEPLAHVGHFAVCAESFACVSEFVRCLELTIPAANADDYRAQLFPSLNASIISLMESCSEKLTTSDFAISPKQEYRGLQKTISNALHLCQHTRIIEMLPTDAYKGWFKSRSDTFTSLSLNSSVRHITHQRPPQDKIFPMVLAMRTLRPSFHLYRCKCGEQVDVCGLHSLKCSRASPSPFVSVHNRVRDATVRALHDYMRRNAPSHLQIFSETQKFHLCEIKRFYPALSEAANRRADAIVFEDSDPFHPWFLDFVQAQIDDPREDKVMSHINRAHRTKITEAARDHPTLPRSAIIPMVFASNGVFHPSSLVFLDWFLVRASHAPVSEPPSSEKLKVLQAISSAIVDQTASILTTHFAQYTHDSYARAFPCVLPRSVPDTTSSRRRKRRFGSASRHQAVNYDALAPFEYPAPVVSCLPVTITKPPVTFPAVRTSERIRARVRGGSVAVGLRGRQ